MTEEVTEFRAAAPGASSPRSHAGGLAALDGTGHLEAPPNSSSFSVSVVLPASGCEMMANVLRCRI